MLNSGLRSGGGIGDSLQSVGTEDGMFGPRILTDLLFFFVISTIILNLVFGLILDAFGALREEKDEKEKDMKENCFVCSLPYATFEKVGIERQDHIAAHDPHMYILNRFH